MMLKRIGNNAYEIELSEDYGVSPTFNVTNLSPYHDEGTNEDLRTSFFNQGRLTRECLISYNQLA